MSRKLVITAIAVALGLSASALALAARSDREATTATVCVKPNGELRLQTERSPACTGSERASQWVVGGEVTAVEAGPGLVGGGAEGPVALAVDPGLIESAQGPKIFAGFDDGPHPIPHGDVVSTTPVEIERLELPAGVYAIVAKLTLARDGFGKEFSTVRCRLEAGADFDKSHVSMEGLNFGGSGPQTQEGTTRLGMALEVVHRLTDPGPVVLSCVDVSFYASSQVTYEDLKIVAIRGSTLSNVYLD